MAAQDLSEYISSAIEKGYGEEQIKAKLKSAGYSDAQVAKELSKVNSSKSMKTSQGKGGKSICIILSAVGIILLAILILYAIIFLSPLGENKPFTIVDTEMCNDITTNFEEYTSCWTTQAPKTLIETADDCNDIEDREIAGLCLAIVSGKPEDCATATYKDFCYSLQVRNRDSSLKCITLKSPFVTKCLNAADNEQRIVQYNYYLFLFND